MRAKKKADISRASDLVSNSVLVADFNLQFLMSKFRPFRAIRPLPSNAKHVASRPYDVLDSNEYRGKLRITRFPSFGLLNEIDLLPTADPYGEEVYRQAWLS